LSWQDRSSNENGFEVLRGLTTTGAFTPIYRVGANVTTYTLFVGMNPSPLTYYYKIRAFNAAGASTESNTVQVKPF
jgi:hypothetical protein